jgi:hypothetical protein
MLKQLLKISLVVSLLLGSSVEQVNAKKSTPRKDGQYFRYDVKNIAHPGLKALGSASQDAWIAQKDLLAVFDGDINSFNEEPRIDSGIFARQL